MFEIFVYSTRFEGVHLRGGKVARGGLRWSDRPEDFRTEVLGLVKAQMVKNTVIVPVGSKGGFVLKKAPPMTDREALFEGRHRLLQRLPARIARPDRQPCWHTIVPPPQLCGTTPTIRIWSLRPTKELRRFPTTPMRSAPNTASGSATRLLRAALATTTRKWASRAARGRASSATFRELGITFRRPSSRARHR